MALVPGTGGVPLDTVTNGLLKGGSPVRYFDANGTEHRAFTTADVQLTPTTSLDLDVATYNSATATTAITRQIGVRSSQNYGGAGTTSWAL